jgi:hypothetical protein
VPVGARSSALAASGQSNATSASKRRNHGMTILPWPGA